MWGEADMGARSFSRRGFLAGASALAAGGVAAGLGPKPAAAISSPVPIVPLGAQPAGLPARQHAWGATLSLDSVGDQVAPRFDRLLFFDVKPGPTPASAVLLEAALRTLERRYAWAPGGLLFTTGWGPGYFEDVLRIDSPIPTATALSRFESPAIDDYHLCLHLACDDEERLADVEAALVDGDALPGADGTLAISPALTWRETRTGFTGKGLPAARQQVRGIPSSHPVPRQSPLFMGFKSGLRKNQATEDAVTIGEGPFADGTTMQVSYMRLQLEHWYGKLDERARVARMYSPETTPEQVKHLSADAKSEPNLVDRAAQRYGVIGHAQTSARARRHGRPLIIRRDFDTVDGGYAGLHFVSVQRSIADFVITRNAMNASGAHAENRAITDTRNNGINEFIKVLKRANYVLPSRANRAFPLLPGRQAALA
jgi:hypothetical protein